MSRNTSIFWSAFFDGATGAGLFGKLRRPGAPTCLVDMRSVVQLKASGEFDAMLEIAYKHGASSASLATAMTGGRVQHASK